MKEGQINGLIFFYVIVSGNILVKLLDFVSKITYVCLLVSSFINKYINGT